MIRYSTEAHVVEICPGSYWSDRRLGAVGCPSLATHVYPGSPEFRLEPFPREQFPHVRLVKVKVTVEELDAPFTRYSNLFLDWALCRASAQGMSAEDEHRFAAQLRACEAEILPQHRPAFEASIAKLRESNPRKVFLDDQKPVPEGWIGAKTADGAWILLTHFAVSDLSLDHDLGHGHGSGYNVACWLETAVLERGYPMPNVTIHSENPVGRANIQRVLDTIQRRLEERVP